MSSNTPASTHGKKASAVIPATATPSPAVQSTSSSTQEKAAQDPSSDHAKSDDAPASDLPNDTPSPPESKLGESSSAGASLPEGDAPSDAQPVQEAAQAAVPLTQQFIQEWEAQEQMWSITRDDIIKKDVDIQQKYTNEHDDFIKREQEYFKARQHDDELMKGANASMVSRNYYENVYRQKIADFHIYSKNGATEKQRGKLLTPIDINPSAEQLSHLGVPEIDDLPFPEVEFDESEAKEKTKLLNNRKRNRSDVDDDDDNTQPPKQQKGNDGAGLRRGARDRRRPTRKTQESQSISKKPGAGKGKTSTKGDSVPETTAPESEEPENASEADVDDDVEPQSQDAHDGPEADNAKKPPAKKSKDRCWAEDAKPVPYLMECETLVNLSGPEFNPTKDPKQQYAILSCHICGGNMSQGTGQLLKGASGMASHYAGGDQAHKDAYNVQRGHKPVLRYCNKQYISKEEMERYVRRELDVAMNAATCNSRKGGKAS